MMRPGLREVVKMAIGCSAVLFVAKRLTTQRQAPAVDPRMDRLESLLVELKQRQAGGVTLDAVESRQKP